MRLQTCLKIENIFWKLSLSKVQRRPQKFNDIQKFDKISQLIWNLVSERQINWEILSNFCGLLRKPELYYPLLLLIQYKSFSSTSKNTTFNSVLICNVHYFVKLLCNYQRNWPRECTRGYPSKSRCAICKSRVLHSVDPM